MANQIVHVVMLYTGDAAQFTLYLVGLAAAVEWIAKRTGARLLIELTPRQVAAAIFAQMAVLLLALLGFKFVVLSGGPGIAVHTILKTGTMTRVFSSLSMALATALAAVGLVRVARMIWRSLFLKRW